MKTQLTAVPEEATPLLRIVEDNVVYLHETYFFAHSKQPSEKKITPPEPEVWDESWFSSYE